MTLCEPLPALGEPVARPPFEEAGARFRPIMDAMTAHIALLDGAGTIVAVNEAWKRFADSNCGRSPGYGLGLNYLQLLDGMQGCQPCARCSAEEMELARRIAGGIRAVLKGRSPKFQIEYPCHSPTERRWFLLTVSPYPDDGGPIRAVVAHEDLTPLRAAQEAALYHSAQLAASFSRTVDAIALAIEKRDAYTAGHQNQVATLCEAIARRLELDEEQRQGLQLGARIHDIGKISVPLDILGKPGKLSPPELEIIRYHPQVGYEILCGIDFPWPIADMVHQHHERVDGSGYPQGLAGEDICLEARIIAVADVFDAIISHRPYRAARSREEGLRELALGRGSRFDARVVDALLAHLAEVEGA